MEHTDIFSLEKDTMSVPEMGKLLGLGKTESYWILKHRDIKTITICGKIRVVKSSFDDWYDRQVKYRRTDGTPPGRRLEESSYSVHGLAQLLAVSDSAIYDLIHQGCLESFEYDYKLRITRDSFEKWYATQDRIRLPEDRAVDDRIQTETYSMLEASKLIGIDRRRIYGVLSSGRSGPKCEFVMVAGHKRVTIKSFEAWLNAQTKYTINKKQEQEAQAEPEETIPEKMWYSIEETAKLTGISKRKLYRMADSMEIITSRIGASLMIPAGEVKRMTQERR